MKKPALSPTLLALFALLAVLLAGAAPVLAAGAPPDPKSPRLQGNQRLDALLQRIRFEQQRLKTLEARFEQHQESSLLAAPEKSTGVFSYAAPDRVRWEYQTPNPISVVIQGDQMTTWYRDQKRAEMLKVGRYSNQVFKYLGASGSLKTLLDYFTVTLGTSQKKGEPFRLELVPRYQRIARRLKSMTIWIDDEIYMPARLRYVEADGDVTEYRFLDMKRNTNIPADRFVLKLPKGVETKVIDLGQESGSGPRR